jgi:prepilin-type N-terminal cleavage/methylation domain-containing protein
MLQDYRARRREGAFTLIELLVVIAIIALLIGILLPAIGRARTSAQDLRCLAQVRSMGQAMNFYAGDYKDWYPVLPVTQPDPRYLQNQETAGGVAGMFSTFQIGDGEGTIDPPSVSGDVRFVGTPQGGPGAYINGSKTPIMQSYLESFEILVCPRDKEDYYFGRTPNQNSRIQPDRLKIPTVPAREQDVIDYNISYLYIAGLRPGDPSVLFPPPLFGDETIAADIKTNAWFGWNWRTNSAGGGEPDPVGRFGFNPDTGYSDRDNHGDAGGNFVFADASASFVSENPQREFFSDRDDQIDGFEIGARSINLIKENRSDMVEVVD